MATLPSPSGPTNIAAHLPDMARRQPFAPALFVPRGRTAEGATAYSVTTFAQLDEQTDVLASGLEALGLGEGTRTALMVPPGLDFFALTFALFKLGAVPVFIDPGLGVRGLGRCLGDAQPECFIGVPRAHAARLALGWARRSLRTTITVGRRLGWGGLTLREVREAGSDAPHEPAATRPDDLAAILFTSGSTGAPKGAVYRHGTFCAQVELLRTVHGIEPGEVDLPTFPLFGLFGPALGMTAVLPQMDFTHPARADPALLIQAIDDFGVTNLFGSPALLDRLSRFGETHDVVLPSLRRIISAGAPVPAAVLERLAPLLAPGVQVATPYGATEALPVCCIESDEILGETRHATDEGAGTCVGPPVAGTDLRIVRITDEPIARWHDDLLAPPGGVGEVVVRGPQVTDSYHGRDALTRLAKIEDPDGTTWHRMGDVGYQDEQGRLWFCGRKAHRVRTPDGPLFTIPCESVLNTHPAVRRSALVGVPAGAEHQRPVACIELEPGLGRVDLGRLRAELGELAGRHPACRGVSEFLVHPGFPVDVRHEAKIFREKLAVWAERRLP